MTNNQEREVAVRDVWKYAAIALMTFLLGLLISGGGYILRAPTRDEVDRISDRQQMVLQRLATLDAQLVAHEMEDEEVSDRLRELESIIREIVTTNGGN